MYARHRQIQRVTIMYNLCGDQDESNKKYFKRIFMLNGK